MHHQVADVIDAFYGEPRSKNRRYSSHSILNENILLRFRDRVEHVI